MGNKILFDPVTVGSHILSNRVVMAPMTRNRAGEGNVPTDLTATYYAQRATAGLIITEAAQISPQGVGYPLTPGIHSPEQLAGWKKVSDAVHAKGGTVYLQLWHVGRVSHPLLQPHGALPVAPSPIRPRGDAITLEGKKPFVIPRELDVHEIEEIVEQYARAAQNAMAAGFDGVEIHAANGYLIDQFLRDGSNRRKDDYGGSPANRLRFLADVTKAVSGAIGAEKVGVRISPENTFNDMEDSDPQTIFTALAHMLKPYGLAYLHVIEGDLAGGVSRVDYGEIRKAFGGIWMVNGGYTQKRAEEAVESGLADLVSFGSLFLANPDLVERFRKGARLNRPDPATFYGGGAEGYTDYPFMA
ncbi:alkene reductase [Desulfobotulus sp. H1]|uniref:Alkene reductase n=1 Tax=Desulfobotulus pelophilus TaxID=2823377 RepID=A0ABT3N8V8_9BACT|nr:alkene reductase [Desulfobotulus pelophilus]MCW7753891.1 alkene reductase [Desulfobotulus pelophilus]